MLLPNTGYKRKDIFVKKIKCLGRTVILSTVSYEYTFAKTQIVLSKIIMKENKMLWDIYLVDRSWIWKYNKNWI